MHAISSYCGNRPIHTHTHTYKQTGPITIHCTTASMQCNNEITHDSQLSCHDTILLHVCTPQHEWTILHICCLFHNSIFNIQIIPFSLVSPMYKYNAQKVSYDHKDKQLDLLQAIFCPQVRVMVRIRVTIHCTAASNLKCYSQFLMG